MSKKDRREFLDLISVTEAQGIIQKNFYWTPLVEILSLEDAKGRVLAKDIISKIDTPPFDRSLMDGFAVRAEDTFEIDETNPRVFKIIDTIPAGKISNKSIRSSFECVKIATGAPIPLGANAVVMVEYTSEKTDNLVEIFRSVSPYENIDPSGSDIMYGETILHKGDVLNSVRLGILASLGIANVEVQSKLKIGILSSGDEIRSPGDELSPGCLYDSNSTVIANLVEESGGVPHLLGICPDNLDILRNKLSIDLKKVDIILISGGTSAGEGDFSYRVIAELGGKLLFHGVSMKPGKPLATGLVDKKLIITLPGFPASAIFAYNTVIGPLLRKWTNTPYPIENELNALLNQKIRSTTGRTHFKLVHLITNGNTYQAYPVKGTSGSISMLERADGYITIPEEVDFLNPGDNVNVTLLRDRLLLPHIVFIGSHDFVIDILFRRFRTKFPEFIAKQIYLGSTGGISAIRQNECDIAGIHLFDETSREYNYPFIEKWNLKDKVHLIKGYKRIQGVFVAQGNPKGIKGLEDLTRPDISFLNRNEGSGTRILLEHLLKDLNLDKQDIKGFHSITYSHSAAASAVSRNKVDISIGIKPYAEIFGTEFIPLAEEEYDFLINKKSLEKSSVSQLIEFFSSKEFRNDNELEKYHIDWF
ncbi:MAG: molybdopterin biosynthesis protein [Candidatus Hermodarchaeota archaeon]